MKGKSKVYQLLPAYFLLGTLLFTGCAMQAGKTKPIQVETLPLDTASPRATDEDPIEQTPVDPTDHPSPEGNLQSGTKRYYESTTDVADFLVSRTSGTGKNNCMLEPILQNPTQTSVTVQWFTEQEGSDNLVLLYEDLDATAKDETEDPLPTRIVSATTIRMSRQRGGKTPDTCSDPSIDTPIYKHVAVVDTLPEYHGYTSERVCYRIATDDAVSSLYTLAAAPAEGTPLRILLTSDLQCKPLCAANLQKVYETVGSVDAVFCDGDLVDVTDRVYDWFYAPNAFWRIFTGTAADTRNGTQYYGAPLLQEAPIYTAVGNHDVMGVYDNSKSLFDQFNNPSTMEHAEQLWASHAGNTGSDTDSGHDRFVTDHSFNTISYEEMFELPESKEGGENYYAVTFGDIRLISMEVCRVWRLPAVGVMGKYSEVPGSGEETYGFGDFIFEPVTEGSEQIHFLKNELQKDDYQNAKYKMVMFHGEAHSLGDNSCPAFTDPVESSVVDPVTGQNMTIYDYPLNQDYIATVIEPLLRDAGTNLLFNAHSHLWNRFVTDSGMNILQTSNVGNSYGAYLDGESRSSLPGVFRASDPRYGIRSAWEESNYPAFGDPQGLEPIAPNRQDLPGGKSCLASNTVTVFSILDTEKGCVDSYYFDTEAPDSEVILFDSFPVLAE